MSKFVCKRCLQPLSTKQKLIQHLRKANPCQCVNTQTSDPNADFCVELKGLSFTQINEMLQHFNYSDNVVCVKRVGNQSEDVKANDNDNKEQDEQEMPPKVGYIYKICNDLDDKVYIGSSINPNNRFRQHLLSPSSQKLRDYIEMLGEEGFFLEIIETLEFKDRKDLFEREDYWIERYDAVEDGLNMRYNCSRKMYSIETQNVAN